MKNTKIKIKCVGGGPIFSICSVWSLTQCHSWNSLPCSHYQTFSIATFYRPPATTISFYSTSSSPEKENPSSIRLGTPGGMRSQKGLRPFNTLQRISDRNNFGLTFCPKYFPSEFFSIRVLGIKYNLKFKERKYFRTETFRTFKKSAWNFLHRNLIVRLNIFVMNCNCTCYCAWP